MSKRNVPPNENKVKRAVAKFLQPIIRVFSKKLYISLQYRYITHHKLNWKNPTRYTEKLQHLRLYVFPNLPLVIKYADRVGARELLKEQGLAKHLIPIIGVYDNVDDIDFHKLPNSFAIKLAHASGYNLIVHDKSSLNITEAKKQIKKWQKTNYGKKTVEPHYNSIKPRIVIEHLLIEADELPIEYKIHVFNGKTKYLYVVTGRGKEIRYSNFYIDWTPFNESQFNYWKTKEIPPLKPQGYEEMVKLAEQLGKDVPFVRADFFLIDGHIYFNEMTFTPAKGTLIFADDLADFEIGEWLDISGYMKKRR